MTGHSPARGSVPAALGTEEAHRHGGEVRLLDTQGHLLEIDIYAGSIDLLCLGRTYWPELVPRDSPIVTEVLCGTTFKVGDVADQRDGAPSDLVPFAR